MDSQIIAMKRLPKKTVRILVLGKERSGKSTLINNMLAEELAGEHHGLLTRSTSTKRGEIIEQHIRILENKSETAEILMYDSTTASISDQGTMISEIQRLGGIEHFDIVLFCCSALHKTVDSQTENLLALLNDSFGRKLWDKTVFVVTFVNMFLSLHSVRMHFVDEAKEEAVKQLGTSLRENFKLNTSVGMSGHFNKIPVVLAGCDKTSCDLPLINNWTANIWKACIRQIRSETRLHCLKVIRVQSIENDSFKNVPKETLVGAATGAVVGTAISPGIGTVLVSATGAVIGGVSAAYSNRKTRRAIRIVNSITLSENMCDQFDDELRAVEETPFTLRTDSYSDTVHGKKHTNGRGGTTTMSTTVIKETIIERKCEIGSFAEEIFEHFSISD